MGGERLGRRIAAAQTVPARGDVAANVDEHLRLARLARRHGAELILFPELSLTGYELDLAAELAFDEQDERLQPLRDLARDESVTIVVGAPIRTPADKLHLSAILCLPNGATDLYTKRRLGTFPSDVSPDGIVPPPEPSVFEPGDCDPVVALGAGSAAIAICADTGDPNHPARAHARGASTYLASMFFTPGELEGEMQKLAGYAREHAMTVVLSNFGGPTGGLDAAGGSAIWTDTGERLAQLGSGSGLVVALETADGWDARTVAG